MSFDLKILNGDLVIGKNSDLDIVEGTEKLTQDILKIAVTPLGALVLAPWYGSSISKTLIGNAFDTKFISGIASGQLRNALETLMSLQKFQAQSNQIVTPEEQIAAIENVGIQRNSTDPRFFSIFISVLSKAYTRVQTDFQVSP